VVGWRGAKLAVSKLADLDSKRYIYLVRVAMILLSRGAV
jgi:hypothetical protein